MTENENAQKTEFTMMGEVVIAISKSIFSGDADGALRELRQHMQENNLKMSKDIYYSFEKLGLIQDEN